MKKKASNFTKAEIDVLVEEIEMRKDVLFGKLSLNLTSDMKKDAWLCVAEKVSEVSTGEVRSAKAVKKKWTDMASLLKKKEAARRREMNMTGGGECELVGVCEEVPYVEQRVVAMLAVESIDGVEGGIDVGVEMAEQKEIKVSYEIEPEQSQQVHSGKKRAAKDSMEEVVLIEKKRLEVEEERLSVEKRRLEVEEKRLKVEEERLAFEKSRYDVFGVGSVVFADE